jgi:hypothetical protein
MLVLPDKAEYEIISEKVKKRLRYERLVAVNALLYFVYFLVPSVVSILLTIFFNVRIDMTVLLIIGILLGIVLVPLGRRRIKVYYVDDNDWAIYYAVPLYENLVTSLNMKNELKKDYREKALKYAENLLSCVQQRWNVGTFKPIREYEKGSVYEFKKNLRYRIIPAIKDGDDAILQKVERIIYNFLAISKTLSIEEIMKLNEKMSRSDGLPNREPLRIGYRARFSGFFKSHKLAKHLLIIGSIALGCMLFGYALLTYWELQKESVLSDTIILFGILVSAYIAIEWSTNR